MHDTVQSCMSMLEAAPSVSKRVVRPKAIVHARRNMLAAAPDLAPLMLPKTPPIHHHHHQHHHQHISNRA
eukprot:15022834-Alexandrium_andersonii.AAC.1